MQHTCLVVALPILPIRLNDRDCAITAVIACPYALPLLAAAAAAGGQHADHHRRADPVGAAGWRHQRHAVLPRRPPVHAVCGGGQGLPVHIQRAQRHGAVGHCHLVLTPAGLW